MEQKGNPTASKTGRKENPTLPYAAGTPQEKSPRANILTQTPQTRQRTCFLPSYVKNCSTLRLVHTWQKAIKFFSGHHSLIKIYLWPAVTSPDNAHSGTERPTTKRRQTQSGFKVSKVCPQTFTQYLVPPCDAVPTCICSWKPYRCFHFPRFCQRWEGLKVPKGTISM